MKLLIELAGLHPASPPKLELIMIGLAFMVAVIAVIAITLANRAWRKREGRYYNTKIDSYDDTFEKMHPFDDGDEGRI